MERGVQYLRELAMRELIYYDPDNVQFPTHPEEIQCTRPMWRKFVQSASSSYANSLAVIDWKGEEAPIVDEVAVRLQQYEESLFSSLISAMENCPGRSSKSKTMCPTLQLYRPASQLLGVSVPLLRREDTEAIHHGALCGFTCVTTERT